MSVPSTKATSPAKFDPFVIHTTSYKTVNDHPIGVDILIPKAIKAGKRPLVVRFHGGFLVSGASLFPWFFPSWVLEFVSLQSAIIVSADYRLLPEGSGKDILEDVADLWSWIHSKLQIYIDTVYHSSELEVDFKHILVIGDSSGSYLALQSALTQPTGSIKMLACLYPHVDVGSIQYNTKFEKNPFGTPMLPSEIVDAHVRSTAPGAVVTSAIPPARIDVAVSMVQNGRYLEFLGSDESLLPIEAMAKVDQMPPTLVTHGREDSVVPVGESERLVKAFKHKYPNTPVRLNVQPGDHGFDGEATLETEWLKEDITFIVEHWLA
ncbi:hypothetical protein MMC17_008319 [Xylographa soralifera]|nr:hypothetical protein [Xylographa soralifera]